MVSLYNLFWRHNFRFFSLSDHSLFILISVHLFCCKNVSGKFTQLSQVAGVYAPGRGIGWGTRKTPHESGVTIAQMYHQLKRPKSKKKKKRKSEKPIEL